MTIKPAQKFFRRLGAWALIAFAFTAFNTRATVVDPKAGNSEFGGSLTQVNRGTIETELNTSAVSTAARDVDGVYTSELEPLGQPINANPVNTSAVPLPAAAWMFLAALLGLVSVARRKQKNES
ncbi:MAG: VPLPA-CTERM sorting domain-containing protein [Halioglobus sp.]|nr:VPLPA-CTERM sorting domain-containing protein [Halioglobus sp.]